MNENVVGESSLCFQTISGVLPWCVRHCKDVQHTNLSCQGACHCLQCLSEILETKCNNLIKTIMYQNVSECVRMCQNVSDGV